MTEPFSPMRVARFLLLCFLGLAAIYLVFVLLAHLRGHHRITTHGTATQLRLPMREPVTRHRAPLPA